MIECFKVVYQVHMLRRDEAGNVVEELATQQPLTLYAHQLDRLADHVASVISSAERTPGLAAPEPGLPAPGLAAPGTGREPAAGDITG